MYNIQAMLDATLKWRFEGQKCIPRYGQTALEIFTRQIVTSRKTRIVSNIASLP